jgi:hypothetical protein
MEEFRPPDELCDLWLGSQGPPEDAAAITQQVLMAAKRYGANLRRFDDMWIAVTIVLLPILFVAGGLDPAAYLADAFMIAALLFYLAVYWILYRKAPSEPDSADSPMREHLAYWLDYLRRRARFHRVSVWGSVFALGAAGSWLRTAGSNPVNLWMAGLFLLSAVFGLLATRYELRKMEVRRANVQRILDDLGSEPEPSV